jgi:hypothetical protein
LEILLLVCLIENGKRHYILPISGCFPLPLSTQPHLHMPRVTRRSPRSGSARFVISWFTPPHQHSLSSLADIRTRVKRYLTYTYILKLIIFSHYAYIVIIMTQKKTPKVLNGVLNFSLLFFSACSEHFSIMTRPPKCCSEDYDLR